MTAARQMGPDLSEAAAPVELEARVARDGDQFLASVNGLEIQSSGRTREAAENALVQAMRGWLERQDTVGRLGQSLGLDDLDEQTEIVLRFVDADAAADGPSGG